MTTTRQMAVRLCALMLSLIMLLAMCGCQLPVLEGQESDTLPEAAVSLCDQPAGMEFTLSSLMDELNAQRYASTPDDYSMASYLPDYSSEDFLADEFSDEEIALLTTEPAGIPSQLTCQQACEDVDYLFRILRTSYGAYTFFGGDEAFGSARDVILDRVNKYYSGGITVPDLRNIIMDELWFVEDTHFNIDGQTTDFPEKYYYQEISGYEFLRDEAGYYITSAAGVRLYAAPEDEQWIKPTIADDGRLIYSIFALDVFDVNNDVPASLPAAITLRSADGSVIDSLETSWKRIACRYVFRDDAYTCEEIDGIPVISLNTYYLEESVFDDINSYLNDAAGLRDEEVIIIDLRYNTGGYDIISEMWLYEFTGGELVDWGIGYSAYVSRLNEYVLNSNAEEINAIFERLDFCQRWPEYWSAQEGSEEYPEGGIYEVELESAMSQNDTVIFALCNKHTYSAGELALFQLENMENVVFVGTNSNGCLLTGGTNLDAPVWLPNSGMSLYYSTILVTSEKMDDFDSDGFQPDIIVDDDDAVQDIIDCWKYYDQE